MKTETLTKHTLLLCEGDLERLRSLHPETGASRIIRTLVRRYLDQTDPKINISKIKGDVNV